VRDPQTSLDLGGKPLAGDILARIRSDSRDNTEKGRWFEQLFMRLALENSANPRNGRRQFLLL